MDIVELNANAGVPMTPTARSEYIENLDIVNMASSVNRGELEQRVERFKRQIASVLSTHPDELCVILTSSGTEANCLMLKALCARREGEEKKHLIISAQEHASIDLCAENLMKHGDIELTLIKSQYNGVVDVRNIISAIKENTVLISLMSINNETGVIHNKTITEVGEYIKQHHPSIVLHSDCVEAFGKYKVDMWASNIHAATVSFYKIHGSQKLGALVVHKALRQRICENPIINSSLLETGISGGTLCYASVAASARALKTMILNRDKKNNRLRFLKTLLFEMIKNYYTVADYTPELPETVLKTPNKWYFVNYSPFDIATPNTILFTMIRSINDKGATRLDGICGKRLKDFMRERNIIVSNGSACKEDEGSGGSEILDEAGVVSKFQEGVVRLSLSDYTVKHEIIEFVAALVYYINFIYPTLN